MTLYDPPTTPELAIHRHELARGIVTACVRSVGEEARGRDLCWIQEHRSGLVRAAMTMVFAPYRLGLHWDMKWF